MDQSLIAGIGNIFFEDDGFGVEVIHRLRRRRLGDGIVARDFGTGGLHLAFELLEPLDHLVVVDATTRGGPPGTLYVLANENRQDDVLAHQMGVALVLGMHGHAAVARAGRGTRPLTSAAAPGGNLCQDASTFLTVVRDALRARNGPRPPVSAVRRFRGQKGPNTGDL